MSLGQYPKPKAAAAIILLRDSHEGAEVYLLRRHRNASFMSSSFVFPGGAVDEGDVDHAMSARRELFEEAGVLLAEGNFSSEVLGEKRRQLNAGEASLDQLFPAMRPLPVPYYSEWITPSAEKKRFHATFYLAKLPSGQVPSPDQRETVEERWLRPDLALAQSDSLNLPPPQLRTLFELQEVAKKGVDACIAFVSQRPGTRAPVLPRAHKSAAAMTLLLPWDAEYESAGTGDTLLVDPEHPMSYGPSRFIRKGTSWTMESHL